MLPAILPPLAGGRRALLGDESVQGEILYRLSRRLEKEGVITKLERSLLRSLFLRQERSMVDTLDALLEMESEDAAVAHAAYRWRCLLHQEETSSHPPGGMSHTRHSRDTTTAPTFSSHAVLAGFVPPPSHAYDPLTDPAHDPAVDHPSSASALDAPSISSASSTASLHGSEPYSAGYNAGSSNAPHGHGQPPGSRPSSTANMHMALSPLQVMYDLQDKELMHLLLPVSPSPERRRQMMGKNRVAAPTAGMHWQSDKQQPPTLPRLPRLARWGQSEEDTSLDPIDVENRSPEESTTVAAMLNNKQLTKQKVRRRKPGDGPSKSKSASVLGGGGGMQQQYQQPQHGQHHHDAAGRKRPLRAIGQGAGGGGLGGNAGGLGESVSCPVLGSTGNTGNTGAGGGGGGGAQYAPQYAPQYALQESPQDALLEASTEEGRGDNDDRREQRGSGEGGKGGGKGGYGGKGGGVVGPSKPLKVKLTRAAVSTDVWSKVNANLQLIPPDQLRTQRLVLLLMCGTFNPVHLMHLRMFYLAKQAMENQGRCHVLGGLLVPLHDSAVRQEIKGHPAEVIPARHRVAMAQKAVEATSWLGVDPWAASRRSLVGYPTILRRVQTQADRMYGARAIKVVCLVNENELAKCNPSMLKRNGCVCVVRPREDTNVGRQVLRWRNVSWVNIVEDLAVVTTILDNTTENKVRRQLMAGKGQVHVCHRHCTDHHTPAIDEMVGVAAAEYLRTHSIPDKLAGKMPWDEVDKLQVGKSRNNMRRRRTPPLRH